MTSSINRNGRRLFDSATRAAATLVAIVHTRLALLSADLEEERVHILSQLKLWLVALFFLGVGLILFTMLIVIAFWESHSLLVLGILAGVFLACGIAACGIVIRQARAKPRLFASSLAELSKDQQQLRSE